ncbi:MAG TPA: FtsX-like permease family protein [Thermoanaerobacterales bacterium]|nr:FtsX-like permease family protein [Thermoanaerobacterales bacterium]
MKKYQKYILKDIKNLLPKLIAIVLIVALGVGFSVGLYTAAPNMRYSVEKYYDNTSTADIIIQGSPFNEAKLNEFKDNELIENAEGYYSFDSDVEFENGMHLAKINVIDFENRINKLTLMEGRLPNKDSDTIEIVIERKQPFLIEVPLGYETTFLDKTVVVVGIVYNPWYFAFVEEISQQEQRPIEIIIYASRELLDEDLYTNINATLKGARNFNTFSDEYENFIDIKVDELKNQYSDFYFTTRNLNQSFAKYKSDVSVIEAIALIFPIFFLLITILVSMSSITRIIEDQRSQIGTLRSLGYSNFSITGKYIMYALISSGLGVVLGIASGVYFLSLVVYNAYKTIYYLPPFLIQYYWGITSIISITMIISVVIVTVGAVMQTLKEKPTELLKVKTQKPGKKIFLERLTFIWKRLKFKYKSTLRNIFRHKKNLILTLIGIGGSTALLLAGFGIKNSVDLAGKYQFEEMMMYNLEISINPTKSNLNKINDYDSLYIMAINAKYENSDYISIIIPKDTYYTNEFLDFRESKNKDINFGNSSVVVTNQFAIKHNLNVGDNFLLTIADKDYNFKVSDIQEYYFGNNIYIAKEMFADDLDINYNKIYVKTEGLDFIGKQDLKNDLEDNENIVKVMFEEDLKYSFQNTSNSMNGIIIILVASACALAIIINYNLILINIHTRKKEIATLKVLGYQEKEVLGYVFRETLIISILAILIGLFFGKGLHYFIISRIVIDGVLLFNGVSWVSYLYTAILSFVFLIIVYLMSIPKTKRINMVDSLKSFE